ncbi:VOC family protein [Frigidibacter sp. MR17.24]|uniref:VOC family protein n=1 Tax=Frigidibacter sp. MR17.24 TaxID=3127345 RepID=UPI0030130B96
MTLPINGLHHVTSLASDARANNAFFTGTLGLRRVKKTVNFDAPDVYHLYYGDGAGTPGSVMTYFPFPHIARGRAGTGEVGETVFAVPEGSLGFWQDRLGAVDGQLATRFGETHLRFAGPDGDRFALVESAGDGRRGWTADVPADAAVLGFKGAALRLRDGGATGELLRFMGYEVEATEGAVTRYRVPGGNGADVIDIEVLPGAAQARQGGGSVHHIAFSVPDRAAQDVVRKAIADTGYQVTPPIDRDYFWAVYFRTPGGVLFEVATDAPGFDRDEAPAHLGEALKLPRQHEHLRAALETHLQPIEA